jgi:hypothetical protein
VNSLNIRHSILHSFLNQGINEVLGSVCFDISIWFELEHSGKHAQQHIFSRSLHPTHPFDFDVKMKTEIKKNEIVIDCSVVHIENALRKCET